MPVTARVPGRVRLAGGIVVAQGALGLGFAVALMVRAIGAERTGQVLGEAGYFLVLSAAVLLVGVGLLRGRRWARTPAIVVQLLLLGVAWYTAGPSGRLEFGLPVAALCVLTVALVLVPDRS
jgi:hypothetical protein